MNSNFRILLFFILMFSSAFVYAQNDTEVTQEDGMLLSKFTESSEGVKNGNYQLFYKDHLIEKGQYSFGKKVGKWQYFNFNKILEYEYDFDNMLVTRIGGEHITKNTRFNTPCYFEGSPLIPYLFMVSNVNYPKGAINNDVTGRVVLTLKINQKGKVYGFYISEKLNSELDKAVMDAARKIPTDWHFFPATREGQSLLSEYVIPIEFELGM
ncbi:TonB family protein [Carboxylicivirga caseinilyticus]|uniref:energy transducer TonB n=1 Tax=Carboxylicivirga caseinilyticus TaxID=3417572 RepID=UPI003D357CC8|nr:energy transducer TonB [Marinilabiliaceae bacterium A049]